MRTGAVQPRFARDAPNCYGRVAGTVPGPVDENTHDAGMRTAERYGLSIYDAMIVASALGAGFRVLLTEDMQDGLTIERRLLIRNPFGYAG